MNLTDVLHSQGVDNMAGLRNIAYFCAYDDIDVFPTPTGSPTTFAQKSTVTADFTFKEGKCWKKFYTTLEMGSIKSTMVGERDGKSHENMAELSHPTNKPELLGFLEEMKNTPMVALVQETDGQIRIIGAPGLPAEISANEVNSGAKIADAKSTKVTIRSIGFIAPAYTGAISLTPAV
jgi:hypothetical protein